MYKKFIFLMILLQYALGGLSQYQWINHPLTGNTFNSVYFVNDQVGYAVGGVGVALSTNNGGKNWSLLNTKTTVNLNGVYFINTDTGFAVGDSGIILKTVDKGANWNVIPSGVTGNLHGVVFTDNLHGYSCGQGGTIIQTSNGGDQWEESSSNVTTDLYSVDFPTKNTGYMVGGKGYEANKGVVLKSNDAGKSWNLLTDSLTNTLYSVDFPDSLTGYAVGNNCYLAKTINGGNTWTRLNIQTATNALRIYSIKFIDSLTGFASGTDGQIIKTTDGKKWENVNSNTKRDLLSISALNDTSVCIAGAGGTILLPKEESNDFYRVQNGPEENLFTINKTDDKSIFVTGYKTLIRTTDTGQHWETLFFPESDPIKSAHFINSSTGYVLRESGIFKTTDAGTTWSKCNGPDQSYYDLYDLFMVNESLGFAVGGGKSSGQTVWTKILKTVDGENWVIDNSLYNLWINKVYFKNNSNGYLLGGGDISHVCNTMDAGKSWSCKDLDFNYNFIDIFFPDDNTGFILGNKSYPDKGNIIYKTVDGGNSWNKMYEKANNNVFWSIFFTDSLNGYVVGELGYIAKTNDGGKNWVPQERFTDNRLNSILLTNDHSGYIIGNNGTFVSFGDIPVGISNNALNPSNTIVCYPNPFNETIQFEIISNSKDQVSIELFDLDGRMIDKVNRTVIPGKQILKLTPPIDIKKGMYIYKIKGTEIFGVGKISKVEK